MLEEVLEFSKSLHTKLERVEYAMGVMQDLLQFACMERVPQEIRNVIATFNVEDCTFLIDGKRVRFETHYIGCTGGSLYDVRTSHDGGETWSKPMQMCTVEKDIQATPLWQSSLEYRFAWTMVTYAWDIFRPE